MKNDNQNGIYIDDTVIIGKDVIIEPNNIIRGNTTISDHTHIGCGNYIQDSKIGSNCSIEFSHITDSNIGSNTMVGPYSRIRPGCKIGDKCKIGNFVEIKNSTLGNNVKAAHLTYIGDATIGDNCNIGCGVVFANYNGITKSRSIVGNDCFIGSNVNVIAPINIADGSYICAGTTITIDTNPDDFIIGRARECVKAGRAKKYKKETK